MKKVMRKKEFSTVFLKNSTNQPKFVLIMPITRSEGFSKTKWEAAIRFMNKSEIETLVVVDKTKDSSAAKYFMENFNLPDRNLYILPRNITESHYESLGSIKLDEKMWVMQLHDDDEWEGYVKLPMTIDSKAAYYSKFYVKSQNRKCMEEKDFTYPARSNFTLIPAHIWNKFSCMIQDQKFHVAGSMDSTLNLMVQLTCKLMPIPDFVYFYDNHNWASRIASRHSLLQLTEKDGWGIWASIDIAILSRNLDNLACLSYVAEFAKDDDMSAAFRNLMQQFKPRVRRKTIIWFEIFILNAIIVARVRLLSQNKSITSNMNLVLKLSKANFIRDSWSIKSLTDVIELIKDLEKMENLSKLHGRFRCWHVAISNLNKNNWNVSE